MNGVTQHRSGNPLLTTLVFSVGLTLVFTLVSNLLPQVEGEAPVEQEVDLGALTMDSFIALGETLFQGKGTCTLCHNAMGRAPDLLAINATEAADKALAEDGYQGEATDAAGYFLESMVDPGVYVVAGFGKKGSNDTESPMPAADKPPIELSVVEMDAIVAFLQAKDGNEVTVALPSEAPAVSEPASVDGAADTPAATAATAQEVVGKYGCQACHSMLGSESPVGPPLDDIGTRMDRAQMVQAIVDPDAVIAEGFSAGMMPADFAARMTVKELDMLVQLLLEQK